MRFRDCCLPQRQTILQSVCSPCWAAEEEQTRILLVLHSALLLNFYDTGILGAQKCCICLEAKA